MYIIAVVWRHPNHSIMTIEFTGAMQDLGTTHNARKQVLLHEPWFIFFIFLVRFSETATIYWDDGQRMYDARFYRL